MNGGASKGGTGGCSCRGGRGAAARVWRAERQPALPLVLGGQPGQHAGDADADGRQRLSRVHPDGLGRCPGTRRVRPEPADAGLLAPRRGPGRQNPEAQAAVVDPGITVPHLDRHRRTGGDRSDRILAPARQRRHSGHELRGDDANPPVVDSAARAAAQPHQRAGTEQRRHERQSRARPIPGRRAYRGAVVWGQRRVLSSRTGVRVGAVHAAANPDSGRARSPTHDLRWDRTTT